MYRDLFERLVKSEVEEIDIFPILLMVIRYNKTPDFEYRFLTNRERNRVSYLHYSFLMIKKFTDKIPKGVPLTLTLPIGTKFSKGLFRSTVLIYRVFSDRKKY